MKETQQEKKTTRNAKLRSSIWHSRHNTPPHIRKLIMRFRIYELLASVPIYMVQARTGYTNHSSRKNKYFFLI